MGGSYTACMLKNSSGTSGCSYSNRSFVRKQQNSTLIVINCWALIQCIPIRKLKKRFVVDMHHLISRLFIVLLAVESDSTLVLKSCSMSGQRKNFLYRYLVVSKIWNIFLAPTGVTQHNLYIEFVCGLRECPPGSLQRQNVSIGHGPAQ